MVSTILSPLVLTAHANVGGWAVFRAFGACGVCVESVTQNRDNPAHPGLDLVSNGTHIATHAQRADGDTPETPPLAHIVLLY